MKKERKKINSAELTEELIDEFVKWVRTGATIRFYRECRCLTQLDLADELGISVPKLRSIERGIQRMTSEEKQRVRQVLRIRKKIL